MAPDEYKPRSDNKFDQSQFSLSSLNCDGNRDEDSMQPMLTGSFLRITDEETHQPKYAVPKPLKPEFQITQKENYSFVPRINVNQISSEVKPLDPQPYMQPWPTQRKETPTHANPFKDDCMLFPPIPCYNFPLDPNTQRKSSARIPLDPNTDYQSATPHFQTQNHKRSASAYVEEKPKMTDSFCQVNIAPENESIYKPNQEKYAKINGYYLDQSNNDSKMGNSFSESFFLSSVYQTPSRNNKFSQHNSGTPDKRLTPERSPRGDSSKRIPDLSASNIKYNPECNASGISERSARYCPLFEEYRKRNFEGVPIYRAKELDSHRNNSYEKASARGSDAFVQESIFYNPIKQATNRSGRPPIPGKYQSNNAMSNIMRDRSCMESERRYSPIPQERKRRESPSGYLREFSPVEQGSFFESPMPMRGGSHRYEGNDSFYGKGTSFYAIPRPNPMVQQVIKNEDEGRTKYTIVPDPKLDYSYVLINGVKGRREPEQPPQVYVEQKRPKGEELNDPFLQTLARTFVMPDDSPTRRKSRALIKYEQSVRDESEEMDQLNSSFGSPNVGRNQSFTQISREANGANRGLPSTRPDALASQDNVYKRPSQDMRIESSESPFSKQKSALKQPSTRSEHRKDSQTVRIKLPAQENMSSAREHVPSMKEFTPSVKQDTNDVSPRKYELKGGAEFLEKLDQMRNRSKGRLNTLLVQSEASTPGARSLVEFDPAADVSPGNPHKVQRSNSNINPGEIRMKQIGLFESTAQFGQGWQNQRR